MSFALLPLNAGDGSGGELIGDQFAQGGSTATVVFSGLCFGALGGGAYQPVDSAHGLPAQIVAALPGGTNVIGHVVVDSIGANVAISAESLPLPTGAATAAKQPAIGTPGASASDVLTVQGIAAMTPLKVDGSAVTQPVSGAVSIEGSVAVTGTFWQETQPVSLASLPALAAGGNLIGQVEISDGANALGTSGHPLRVDPTGTTTQPVAVTSSVAVTGTFWPATQPVSGTVGVDSLPALASGSANVGYATPAVAGQTTGASPFHLGGSAATVNATSVKAGACTLWDVIAMNVSTSAPAYLKLYDKASAPTIGTDAPVYVLPLPTAGSANGAGAARSWPTGLKFTLGLAYAITGGMADTDATAVAAGQVCLSGSYG